MGAEAIGEGEMLGRDGGEGCGGGSEALGRYNINHLVHGLAIVSHLTGMCASSHVEYNNCVYTCSECLIKYTHTHTLMHTCTYS